MPQPVQAHRVNPIYLQNSANSISSIVGNAIILGDAKEIDRYNTTGTFSVYTVGETDAAIQAACDALTAKLTTALIDKLGASFMDSVFPTIEKEMVSRVQLGLEAKYASELNNLKSEIANAKSRIGTLEGLLKAKGE